MYPVRILLYPDCILHMYPDVVKGQGVDTYVELYPGCILAYSGVSLPDPEGYIRIHAGYIRIRQDTDLREPPPEPVTPPRPPPAPVSHVRA